MMMMVKLPVFHVFIVTLLFLIRHVYSFDSVSSICEVSLYYSSIDFSLNNNDLKKSLKELIFPHRVIDYDTVWSAFPTVDIYLPRYPCNTNTTFIPDVYSSYCWNPEKNLVTGGECGNYKKEGDCFNREHLWPKSWFGGFDYGMVLCARVYIMS